MPALKSGLRELLNAGILFFDECSVYLDSSIPISLIVKFLISLYNFFWSIFNPESKYPNVCYLLEGWRIGLKLFLVNLAGGWSIDYSSLLKEIMTGFATLTDWRLAFCSFWPRFKYSWWWSMKCFAHTFYLLNSSSNYPDNEFSLKFKKVFIFIKYSAQFYSLNLWL